MTKDQAIDLAIKMFEIIYSDAPYEKRWIKTTIDMLDSVIYTCEQCQCLHCECDEYDY